MVLASGINAELRYIEESTRNMTPATPNMKVLRAVSRNVNLTKNILESDEVRSTRQKLDVRHGFNQVAGTPGFRLAMQAYNDFIRFALGGTWTTPTVDTGSSAGMSVINNDAYSRPGGSGSFITEGFRPGDWVTFSGFTNGANNATRQLRVVTATYVQVVGDGLVTESASQDHEAALAGKRIATGTDLKTFTMERAFKDIDQYQKFTGVCVNTWDLSIQPEQIVGGSFGLLGMQAYPFQGTTFATGGVTTAPTNKAFSAFDGSLYEGGSLIALVTGITLNVNNNRSLTGVVGSKFSPDVFEGDADITGSATFLFENATQFNKFANETDSTMWIRLNETGTSEFMSIVIPRVIYTGGEIDPPQRGPVPITMPFRAAESTNSLGEALRIQRSIATDW